MRPHGVALFAIDDETKPRADRFTLRFPLVALRMVQRPFVPIAFVRVLLVDFPALSEITVRLPYLPGGEIVTLPARADRSVIRARTETTPADGMPAVPITLTERERFFLTAPDIAIEAAFTFVKDAARDAGAADDGLVEAADALSAARYGTPMMTPAVSATHVSGPTSLRIRAVVMIAIPSRNGRQHIDIGASR